MSSLMHLLNKHFIHIIVHSGQHYDPNLDDNLFKELKLPNPQIRLKTGSGNFAEQITKQIEQIFEVLNKEKPNFIIVQGDTNTAFSGALVARRLGIKVIHIESGCRSGNLDMPEEQNRLMIDSISDVLFCSDKQSFFNLKKEGHQKNIFRVGSTTFDAILRSRKLMPKKFCLELGAQKNKFILATLHRAENMKDLDDFMQKIAFVNFASQFLKVIFPIHPRTKKFINENNIKLDKNVIAIDPISHLPFISLLSDCHFVITDSGGIQEEAICFNRPCLILRQETEWMRMVKAKKNFLIKSSKE